MTAPSPMTDVVARAFAEPVPDFVAWRALGARVRPLVRQHTDAECRRRLGRLAGDADRAEAFDIIWRHLLANHGAMLKACAGVADFDAAVTDRVLDLQLRLLIVLDRRLVQRWQAGDERAGNHIAVRLRAVVYARVHRVLGRKGWGAARADDFAQDAWLQVTRSLAKWRPDGGTSLENWVGTATERAVRSALRDEGRQKKGRDVVIAPVEDASTIADRGLDPEERARLASAVEAIEAAARAGMTAKRLEMAKMLLDGRSVDDVATAFGVKAGEVYKAKSQLKKITRTVLDG